MKRGPPRIRPDPHPTMPKRNSEKNVREALRKFKLKARGIDPNRKFRPRRHIEISLFKGTSRNSLGPEDFRLVALGDQKKANPK